MPEDEFDEEESEGVLTSPKGPEVDKAQEDVKSEIDTFRRADIMHSNFEQYLDRFLSAWRIITTQLNQKFQDIQTVTAEEKRQWQALVRAGGHEEDTLPREFMEMKEYKIKFLEDTREWQEVAMHLAYLLVQKLANVLATTKSLDIEKHALEGQRMFIKDFYERLDKERREEVIRIAQINERQARSFEYAISRMIDQISLRDALLQDMLENLKIKPRAERVIEELQAKLERAEAEKAEKPAAAGPQGPAAKMAATPKPKAAPMFAIKTAEEDEEADEEALAKKIAEMKLADRSVSHKQISEALGVTKDEVKVAVRKLRADGVIP